MIAWIRGSRTLKAYGAVPVRVLDMDKVGVVFNLTWWERWLTNMFISIFTVSRSNPNMTLYKQPF
jgi:hypothetical protein